MNREWAAGRGNDKRDVRRFSPPPHEGSPPRMKRMRRDWLAKSFEFYEFPWFKAVCAKTVCFELRKKIVLWRSGIRVQLAVKSGVIILMLNV